ncbi:MAG: helix-turn-helix transcriptional regulator [Lachnospiraceae bacterium]|nr:helix-turn-helix transcriptional regulator [Lachnospiraceae bacterium]
MKQQQLSDYWHESVNENPHLPVRFEDVRESDSTFPVHWHEYWEFICVQSGSMHAVIHAQNFDLSPGDILVVNSEELHMTKTGENTRYLLLQINKKYFAALTDDPHKFYFSNLIRQDRQCVDLFMNLLRIQTEAKDGYPFLFTAGLYELFYHIYRNHSASPAHIQADQRERSRMTELLDWIKDNLMDDLTLDVAADHLHVTREYFCRIFRRYTGQTFLEYLYSLRTMDFFEKLKCSDDPIPVLMEKSHLSNYKVFIRTFKKLYGETPQSIRKSIS